MAMNKPLNRYKLKAGRPVSGLSRHLLIDKAIIDSLIKTAQIKKEDTVLEIGPGTGNITKSLAKSAGKVIAIEIDKQVKPVLEKFQNVELVFGDAIKYLKTKPKGFNKIVSNPPYEICEALLHHLTFARHVELTLLVVPKSFSLKIEQNPVFSAFFTIQIIKEVPKEAFYPVPRTSSVIVCIAPRALYEEDKDESAFVRRKLYMQEDKKLKNALCEAIIDLYKLKHNKQLTKRNASKIIESMHFEPNLLETKIKQLPLTQYSEIANRVERLGL